MKTHYKIGFIGLGSIARRHLSNVCTVLNSRNCTFEIDIIRSAKGHSIGDNVQKLISNIYYSFDDVPYDYDILFITNPTSLHFETVQKYANKAKNMFIEKPVFDTNNVDIESLKLNKAGIYYVACPLRYTDVVQKVKEIVAKEKVFSARVICSSYLPEWRPGQDYRTTYSSHKNQGGGVSIDLIHEWDYICYLFGMPQKIINVRDTFSNLEIDSDDLSLYIGVYKDKAIEVHLDYFGRKSIRQIQLFTENDTIEADIVNSEIRYLKSGETISFCESRNDFQLKELQYFFDIIEGKAENRNDISTALSVLKIAREGNWN